MIDSNKTTSTIWIEDYEVATYFGEIVWTTAPTEEAGKQIICLHKVSASLMPLVHRDFFNYQVAIQLRKLGWLADGYEVVGVKNCAIPTPVQSLSHEEPCYSLPNYTATC